MNKLIILLAILCPAIMQAQTLEEKYDLALVENATDNPNVKVYKDLRYNRLFTRSRGWNGGDGVQTVKLPNGDVFWTFNDSFYGVVNDRRSRGNCSFPRNSIMVQKSHKGILGETDKDLVWLADYVDWTDPQSDNYFKARTHLRHPRAALTDAEIKAGKIDQDYLYWAGDMTVQNGKLQVYWNAVDKNMKGIGTAVATYSLKGKEPKGYYLPDIPDYKPQKGDYLYMESVQHDIKTNPWAFGNTLLEGDDGHIYLYHSVNNFTTVVARTTKMDLKSPLQYYINNGGQWTWQDSTPTREQLAASNIITDKKHHDVSMPWVFKRDGWYYMTAQGAYFSHDIYIFRSKAPYGPFGDGRLLFTLPGKLDKLGDNTSFRYYMINLHTALSRDGELVFSTNSENTIDFWHNFNDEGSADWYRPYFYRVYNWEAVYTPHTLPINE